MCLHHHGNGSPSSSASAPTRDHAFDSRRRSVDVGGLALALGAASLGDEHIEMGKGWGGWEESELSGSMYAELLSDMYTQTQNAVKQSVLAPFPPITTATRERLIDALDSWHFEPHKLPDEQILACTQLLFEAVLRIEGMQTAVGVSITQLSSFLLHLRQAYRATNSYHNFQHALDVFQATHMYLRTAGAVPPVSILHFPESDPRGRWTAHDELRATWIGILRREDIFALCIAAVGHDVGHPGFNNIFMKNAQAPLSQVYDHKSALEQMHCAFLLPIMKRHGLAHLLNPTSSGGQSQFRRLLLDTVLATDMGVHAAFMLRFGNLMERPHNFDIIQARTLVCQALIKCADISNPSRPHAVSQHWSAALASEWASQALLERQLCLPVSVQDSDDPTIEANGQISFITLFCAPLLEITTLAIPEMKTFADQCSTNCMLWRTRLSELQERAERVEPNYPPVPYRASSPSQSQDYQSIFPLSLPSHLVPISRATSVIDTESLIGSDTEHETTTSNVSRLNGHGHGGSNGSNGTRYAGSTSSSSRSGSPSSSFPNNSYTFPPDPQSQHPVPSISTDGFNPKDPYSPLSSEMSPTAESLSPRSEYAPRTPSSSAGGPAHSGAPYSHHSSVASVSSVGGPSSDSSIRAAYKLSVRKKKSFHRNSWTPSLTSANAPSVNTGYSGTRTPPVPNPLSSSGLRSLIAQGGVGVDSSSPVLVTSPSPSPNGILRFENNINTSGT